MILLSFLIILLLLGDEIHPSMTANMDTEHIAGIISEKVGDTSHASILARALEIPAVLSWGYMQ